MNPHAKKLWLAALRSGKYLQGKGYMRRAGRHCCLGVLQECALKAGVIFEPEWGKCAEVPWQVKDWSEIKGTAESMLAKCNDGDIGGVQSTFEEIALMIENGL